MSVRHHHQMIAVPAGLIKVMQNCDHRFPLGPEFAHQPHQFYLVIDIEIGGWLIEEYNGRILGQDHRQKGALALTAGKFG
jgi:hypothetical protein